MVLIMLRSLLEQNCISFSPFSFIVPVVNFPTFFGQFIHHSFLIFSLTSPITISLLFLGMVLGSCCMVT